MGPRLSRAPWSAKAGPVLSVHYVARYSHVNQLSIFYIRVSPRTPPLPSTYFQQRLREEKLLTEECVKLILLQLQDYSYFRLL